MWALPGHISISLTSEESPGLKQKPLIHLAHLNRQYPNAVSIAGGHRNTSFLTRDGSCILPPTNNSLEDTDSILQAQTSQLYPNFCSRSPTRLNITAAACSRLGFDAVLEMAGKHRLPCWTAAEKSHSFCQITGKHPHPKRTSLADSNRSAPFCPYFDGEKPYEKSLPLVGI